VATKQTYLSFISGFLPLGATCIRTRPSLAAMANILTMDRAAKHVS
jgi:hypothetical protein